MSKLSSTPATKIAETKDAPAATPTTASEIKTSANYGLVSDKLLKSAAATDEADIEKMLMALEQASTLPGVTDHKHGLYFIDGLLKRIDEQVNSQLNQVMHAPEFLKLEGTWRGLNRLLKETDTNKTLWVEMFNASKDELQQDFLDMGDYTKSALWNKIYENRYDLNGGKPYGAFVSGYEFSNLNSDVDMLESIAGIGGAAQAPFILSASPKLLGIDSFEKLKNLDGLKNRFNAAEYTKWNALRKNPDSRFLAMTMPRVLARVPYGSKTRVADGLPTFEEAPMHERSNKLAKMDNKDLCWSSSAYSFGNVLTKAFRQTNWCTAIVGESRNRINGGTVSDLPLYQYYNEADNLVTTIPTETVITGKNEYALAELGLLPLSYESGSTRGVFVGGKTMFEPSGLLDSTRFKNEFVASVLANVLPAARISHYVKRIGRKFHGQFSSPKQLKKLMNDWLSNFKTDESADEVGKTSHPLSNYTVDVEEGARPGDLEVKLTLKFWDMIYQINADVEMVAKLPSQT
ncbi:MAG TPA: type VI secretion system contractile sheath large subunit [Tepidisphaeraceae bacterium]|jgi:type VI secretion system protein ImpC|nr:type VI secretion system contractile sheath large subunit [Tepidisphaeraceae bacterium]